MASSLLEYDCPVCHDDFSEPKILPCAHLVCKKCVLSWLKKEGQNASCPLCRAAILPKGQSGQGDLVSQVDALPTDLHKMALVRSHQVLQGSHCCSVCDNDAPGTAYCMQCEIKLCIQCVKIHQKIPATKHHKVEDLDKLTVQKLAATYNMMCKIHPDRPTELYCPNHKEVICIICASTDHRHCERKRTVEEEAKVIRVELKQRAKKLREEETEWAAENKNVRDHYKAIYKTVQDTFDNLQEALNQERNRLISLLQLEENSCLAHLSELEKSRIAFTQNAAMVEQLAESSSEGALLHMLQPLRTRLNSLEPQAVKASKPSLSSLQVDYEKLKSLKTDIKKIGFIRSEAGAKEFKGKMMRVGGRVKRGSDWTYGNQDGNPPGHGTITAINPHKDHNVWVKWDAGEANCYRLGGKTGRYDIELL